MPLFSLFQNTYCKREIFFARIGIGILLVGSIFIAFITTTTYDAGDSIMHYLFSRYSYQHPEYFLHHWGKPVYILISSPFSQFGFIGIKIFNCIVIALSAYLVYLSAKKLDISFPYLGILFFYFSPKSFLIQFSGLTEPLFGLFLILSVYLMLRGNVKTSLIVLSFLPFIRTEGIIIILIFCFLLIIRKNFRVIPLLLTGFVAYSIAGYFYYEDIFWVINQNPYAKGESIYGSGKLFHYVEELYYITGMPVYLLLATGFISIALCLGIPKLKKKYSLLWEESLLVYGSVIAFLFAHSIFWWLGILGSFGMSRVLLAIMPLLAIIALNGLNLVTVKIFRWNWISYSIAVFIIGAVMWFPFTNHNGSINFSKEFDLFEDQKVADEIVEWYKKSEFRSYYIYYSHPYFAIPLNIDPFDTSIRKEVGYLRRDTIPQNAIIFWEQWYSEFHQGISLEYMNEHFKFVKTFENHYTNYPYKIYIFATFPK